jgi:hypothetical protein
MPAATGPQAPPCPLTAESDLGPVRAFVRNAAPCACCAGARRALRRVESAVADGPDFEPGAALDEHARSLRAREALRQSPGGR